MTDANLAPQKSRHVKAIDTYLTESGISRPIIDFFREDIRPFDGSARRDNFTSYSAGILATVRNIIKLDPDITKHRDILANIVINNRGKKYHAKNSRCLAKQDLEQYFQQVCREKKRAPSSVRKDNKKKREKERAHQKTKSPPVQAPLPEFETSKLDLSHAEDSSTMLHRTINIEDNIEEEELPAANPYESFTPADSEPIWRNFMDASSFNDAALQIISPPIGRWRSCAVVPFSWDLMQCLEP